MIDNRVLPRCKNTGHNVFPFRALGGLIEPTLIKYKTFEIAAGVEIDTGISGISTMLITVPSFTSSSIVLLFSYNDANTLKEIARTGNAIQLSESATLLQVKAKKGSTLKLKNVSDETINVSLKYIYYR